jgi:nucleotide-binding universal stress UspA family protein
MAGITWKRILAPTDFSPFAEETVRYAHGLAEACGAELHVLHVARDVSELSETVFGVVEPGAGEDESSQWLAQVLGEPGPVRRVEAVRFSHDVAGAIAGYASKLDVDLIVITTHGRTGLRHLLVGSVAEHLLRAAPCPVLVLRPKTA